MIPLSLYIHLPWCLRKCPYCDFNSYSLTATLPEKEYIDALLIDLKQDLSKVSKRSLTTIFIGGGTPSLFSPHEIDRLLNSIHHLISFEKDIEITMEANPATFKQQQLADFHSAGINRLSIGIQSFQDEKLKSLGRIHNAHEAKQAIDTAFKSGFDNLNIDLMHGLPNQSVNDALFDLETGISFNPTHLSWYELTIEPKTFFGTHPPLLPEEETLNQIQEAGNELLTQNHYQHYEISAYCQPNSQCQHNVNYWTFGDYLGIGAGAHSKITDINENKQLIITRTSKTKEPNHYLINAKNSPSLIENKRIINKKMLPIEFMMNALRLIDGVPTSLFEERTGLKLEAIQKSLKQAKEENFLENRSDKIKTTSLGNRFLNTCLQLFNNHS